MGQKKETGLWFVRDNYLKQRAIVSGTQCGKSLTHH